MCKTLDELDVKMRTGFEAINKMFEAMNKLSSERFDSLEHALIRHAEQAPAALSPMLHEIKRDIKEVKESTKGMGDRISLIELWKAELKGGGMAVKGMWGMFAFLFIGGIIALFQMHDAINRLPQTVHDEVSAQLDDYQINIVER